MKHEHRLGISNRSNRHRLKCRGSNRRGAVVALFAILLPVVLLLCGVVINIAYMQLNRTELRVATDASARAAGRAFSEYQDVDQAKDYAVSTAALNRVGHKYLEIRYPDNSDEIEFGRSSRLDNGYGRYEFDKAETGNVRNQTERATAIRVWGKRDSTSLGGTINMLFAGFGPFTEFEPVVSSTSTQVDRDIALVLDRSGSMASSTIDYTQYRSYERRRVRTRRGWRWRNVEVWDPPEYETYYDQWSYDYNRWQNGGPNPRHSRWASLEVAVDAFLTVLDDTDQEELVSVSTFSTSSTMDLNLTSNYEDVSDEVASKRVTGWTAIGEGMQDGFPTLYGSYSRPYAAKTIVVLTDGNHNRGINPISYAQQIVQTHNVVIHTVTFSDGADQNTMREVARIGGGKHYHSNDTSGLVEIFEEIANNLPTIITE